MAGDVRIDFSGADGGMTEKFLDDAKIRAVFKEVSGEAVAEHVGRDVARNSGVADAFFDAKPESHRGKWSAPLGEENVGR